jgi:pimeloyl-ACP methyl ester carboxylesterase
VAAWCGLDSSAQAQSNVRAWSAAGQVFVVWTVDANPPLAYEIHRSATPLASTTQGVLAGRVFEPEWSGARLKIGNPGATWRVPTAGGGTYQLAANEGLFVHTPRASANEHYSVVRLGATTVTAANRTAGAVAVGYDPVNQPVSCHPQTTGTTNQGYPFRTWAMWVDGRDDHTAARPDFPVLANAAKAGAPHVFTVFEPRAGLPSGPYTATVCLHGGGQNGSHWAWAPESFHYANDEATPVHGVTIAMDDRLFVSSNGVVSLDRPTNWFGWHPGLDPMQNTVPASTAIVVPYTLRRLMWTIDWLQTRSPYAIDAQRTSVMGNSMGGAGTLLLSRYRPERFSSATAFVPQHYTPETGQRLFGTPTQNLATAEIDPGGAPLRVNDFFDPAVRLSVQSRDYCVTRIFRGRRDTAVEWGALTLQLFREMDEGRFGTHLYWDNRDHTASDWTSDDPAIAGIDIGEWVHPVRTSRSGAPYQARYRANQSYPGFFGDDQDPATAGRQPGMGNGSPDDGAPWGTWGGYYDWDLDTIFDAPTGWACSLHLIGLSSTSVDNFPGTRARTSLVVRKPRRFVPVAGATVAWQLRAIGSDAVLQSGLVGAEPDGAVMVVDLEIPRDPTRVRLELQASGAPRLGDLDGDGTIGPVDLAMMQAAPVDLDGDGVANIADAQLLELHLTRNWCPFDADGDGSANCGDLCPQDPAKTTPGACGCGVADTDADGDGVPDCNDNCDAAPNGSQADQDGDGVGDACDNCVLVPDPSQADCDGDALGDACELAAGAADCNGNGIPDSCDLASGASSDINSTGVPDECEPSGGAPFCLGDGGCPCGNNTPIGSNGGCLNALGASAVVEAIGMASLGADTIALAGRGMPDSSALYFQGSARQGGGSGTPFGDGKRCAGGTIVRLGTKINSAGASHYPTTGDLPVATKGMVVVPGTRTYQVWYRNAAAYCTPATFNLTNGLQLQWGP